MGNRYAHYFYEQIRLFRGDQLFFVKAMIVWSQNKLSDKNFCEIFYNDKATKNHNT